MATELDDAALLPIASVLDVCFVFSLLRCLLEIEEEVALSFESDRLSDRAPKIREMTTIAPANIEMIFFICDTSSVIVTFNTGQLYHILQSGYHTTEINVRMFRL
ncbi:hypothetical protein EFL57_05865 [Weissella confusa]|nr:hypothetical protein [Weissella confusa]